MTTTPATPVKIRVELVGIAPEGRAIMWAGLAEIGFEPESHDPILLSQDVPTWINFILDGSALIAVFGWPAGAYLKKIAEKYAEEHFEHRREIAAKGREVLARFVQTCRKTAANVSEVTLEFRREWLQFKLPILDEDRAIELLARLVDRFSRISNAVNPIRDKAKSFPVEAEIHAEDEGYSLTWEEPANHCSCRQRYTSDDMPIGKLQRRFYDYGTKPENQWRDAD